MQSCGIQAVCTHQADICEITCKGHICRCEGTVSTTVEIATTHSINHSMILAGPSVWVIGGIAGLHSASMYVAKAVTCCCDQVGGWSTHHEMQSSTSGHLPNHPRHASVRSRVTVTSVCTEKKQKHTGRYLPRTSDRAVCMAEKCTVLAVILKIVKVLVSCLGDQSSLNT